MFNNFGLLETVIFLACACVFYTIAKSLGLLKKSILSLTDSSNNNNTPDQNTDAVVINTPWFNIKTQHPILALTIIGFTFLAVLIILLLPDKNKLHIEGQVTSPDKIEYVYLHVFPNPEVLSADHAGTISDKILFEFDEEMLKGVIIAQGYENSYYPVELKSNGFGNIIFNEQVNIGKLKPSEQHIKPGIIKPATYARN